MKNYDLFIFDMDNTLVDSRKASIVAYEKAFEAVDLSFDESTINFELTRPLTETYFKNTKNGNEHDYKLFYDAFVEESDNSYGKLISFFHDSIDFFKVLKNKNKKIAIFTNRNKEVIYESLAINNLTEYVDFVCGCDEVEKLKPAPDGILLCLKYFDIEKSKAIFFGDAENDRLSSQNANIDFQMVDRFADIKRKSSIRSFEEILPLLFEN